MLVYFGMMQYSPIIRIKLIGFQPNKLYSNNRWILWKYFDDIPVIDKTGSCSKWQLPILRVMFNKCNAPKKCSNVIQLPKCVIRRIHALNIYIQIVGGNDSFVNTVYLATKISMCHIYIYHIMEHQVIFINELYIYQYSYSVICAFPFRFR